MGACAKGLPPRDGRAKPVASILGVLRTWACIVLVAFPIAGMLGHEFRETGGVQSMIAEKTAPTSGNETVAATRLVGDVDGDGFPPDEAWRGAEAVHFDQDWQGKNADTQRETEVRLLWTKDALYLKFVARYRSITVFPDAEPNGRRDQLWNRDVAEVFLQPPGWELRHYTEFEVSPNGFWIDLDIAPGEKHDLQSGLKRRVHLDEKNRTWAAELALPMKSLTAQFDPGTAWRVNFFRVEGPSEPRFYSAWQATRTPMPNFHVPERFGTLVFKQ